MEHKKNFDKAVKDLQTLKNKLSRAKTPAEISVIEREGRNALMAVIHYSNFLSFWFKEAADNRRKKLREQDN